MTCTKMAAEIEAYDNGFYGILIRFSSGHERKYEDVTTDLALLEKLVGLINEGQVSALHVDELIEDIIG